MTQPQIEHAYGVSHDILKLRNLSSTWCPKYCKLI